MSRFKGTNILIKVTGSIATYKACELISLLKKEQANIRVVASDNALKFVGESTWEGLIGNHLYKDTFEPQRTMSHIDLARWADVIVLYPATANTINKLAAGIADDLIGSLYLSYDIKSKPYLIAPAMNTKMLEHPQVQKSFERLSSIGYKILPTLSGELACGEVGSGKVLSPIDTLDFINKSLNKINNSIYKRVLITAGGTQEPIDSVRYITNFSTGRTSASIADSLIQLGFKVDYLHGKQGALPSGPCEKIGFGSFSDLEQKLKACLSQSNYDVIIHAAAISDYSVKELLVDGEVKNSSPKFKLNSQSQLNIKLKKNPKLISQFKEWSKNKNALLFGFKLTSGASKELKLAKISELFKSSNCQYVIHNDFSEVTDERHHFKIYCPTLDVVAEGESKAHLSELIIRKIDEHLSKEPPQSHPNVVDAEKSRLIIKERKYDLMS